ADTPAHIPAATRQHLLAVIQQVAQATLPVLQQTLDQLGHQLDAGGAAKPAQALLLKVQRGLIPQLRTIHTLLLRSDMQALEMYDALCLRHAGLEHSWQALDKAIKAFDFRQAALECSTLLQRMGDR
ncbi:MAG: hypothetical protein ORN28_04230, partial [Rhodoferax sp.]|nr:hypothetical protein [Rhodoferax sp.]